MTDTRSDALVLFSATGDLARKELFPALYRLAGAGRLDLPIIGVALSDFDSDDAFRRHARQAIEAAVDDVDEPALRSEDPVHSYPPDGWGPEESSRIPAGGRGHQPSTDEPV